VIDHAYDRRKNPLVGGVQRCRLITVVIATLDRELEPGLCFSYLRFDVIKLADERGLVAPLAPAFGEVGTDRS